MTPDEKRAYGRGYNAGVNGRWPLHHPPLPPDSPLVADLMDELTRLCDRVDGMCATFDKDDEVAAELMELVDSTREAMARIGEYARKPGGVTGGQP